jgi:hypothetical protein
MDSGTLKDCDGNSWAPFVNQYQQRQLLCVAGPREGDVIHDPRLGRGAGAGHSISSRDPVQPARDPRLEGLYSKPFWE